jgi:hypothetical protein
MIMDNSFAEQLALYAGDIVSAIVALAWAAIAGLLARHAPQLLKVLQAFSEQLAHMVNDKRVQTVILWAAEEALAHLRNPDRTDVEDEQQATQYAAKQLERRVPDTLKAVGVITSKQVHDLAAVRVRKLLWADGQ